jgi:hypothetical protein
VVWFLAGKMQNLYQLDYFREFLPEKAIKNIIYPTLSVNAFYVFGRKAVTKMNEDK